MNKRVLYIVIFIFLLSVQSWAQNAQAHKKTLKSADDAYERLDFLRAYDLYSEITLLDTTRKDLVFRMGHCLFSINYTDTSSIKYFNATKNYVNESHFFAGRMMLYGGQLREALDEFYYFKSVNTETMITNDEVKKWIVVGEQAIKEESKKQSTIIRNLGNRINTRYAEYVPLLWNVNGSLIFTSRRDDSKGGMKDPYGRYYEDIYIAQRTAEGWSSPSSISDNINSQHHDACVSLSPSGKELLIYRTDEKQTGGDIYISVYEDQNWSPPQKLGPEINSEYLETSACFSSSGNEIVFSSNRPGGMGGRDLYIVRKFMNGKYSKPYNLGAAINSVEDEDAPFIDKNDNTLYFSSRGRGSMGEYDIFFSAYNSELDKWEQAENLGMPINSTSDDIYFFKPDDKNSALFTSRREGGFGDADIYEVNFDESTQLILHCSLNTEKLSKKENARDVQLSLFNTETGKVEGIYRPSKSYMTMIMLATIDVKYKLIVEGTAIEPVVKTIIFNDKNKEFELELHDKNN